MQSFKIVAFFLLTDSGHDKLFTSLPTWLKNNFLCVEINKFTIISTHLSHNITPNTYLESLIILYCPPSHGRAPFYNQLDKIMIQTLQPAWLRVWSFLSWLWRCNSFYWGVQLSRLPRDSVSTVWLRMGEGVHSFLGMGGGTTALLEHPRVGAIFNLDMFGSAQNLLT